ncbi:DUF3800 domain-containing protein [Paenibacillus sp. FSL R5-0636]
METRTLDEIGKGKEKTMTIHDLYCDESGNSGGNYLDPQQPFYVLAGWLIQKDQRFKVDGIVRRYLKEYYPEKTELKGAEILKSNQGQKIANQLFHEVGKLGCVPLYIIAEKKYCISGKIVEAFLDSEHNDIVLPVFSWMNGVKKSIAEIIYNDCPQSIAKFANVHNNLSIEGIIDVQQTIISELNNSGHYKIAQAISGSSGYMEDILWEETHSLTAMKNKALHSLNLPTFASFIQLSESFARKVGMRKVRFFHDETKQFEEAYPEAFNWYRKGGKATFRLENGAEIISGFDSLQVFKMVKSTDTPMIQLADLFASFTNLFATRIYLNKRISHETIEFGKLIIGGMLASDNEVELKMNDTVTSINFLNTLLESVGLQVKIPNINRNTGIERYLSK